MDLNNSSDHSFEGWHRGRRSTTPVCTAKGFDVMPQSGWMAPSCFVSLLVGSIKQRSSSWGTLGAQGGTVTRAASLRWGGHWPRRSRVRWTRRRFPMARSYSGPEPPESMLGNRPRSAPRGDGDRARSLACQGRTKAFEFLGPTRLRASVPRPLVFGSATSPNHSSPRQILESLGRGRGLVLPANSAGHHGCLCSSGGR